MFKKIFILVSCLTSIVTLPAAQIQNSDEANTAIASELLGYSIGKGLKNQDSPFDKDAVIKGFINALEGGPPPISNQDCENVLDKVQEKDITKMKEKALKSWKKLSKTAQ